MIFCVHPALVPPLSHLLSDGGADVGAGLEHHGVTIGIAIESDLGDGLAQLGVRPLQDVAVRAPQDVRGLKCEGRKGSENWTKK